jgi:hypothetical protein
MLPDTEDLKMKWTLVKELDLGKIYDSAGQLIATTYGAEAARIVDAHNAEPEQPSACYHVAWSAQTAKGASVGDLAVEVKPHIHMGNLIEVRNIVAEHADAMLAGVGLQRTSDLVLTSVTRL